MVLANLARAPPRMDTCDSDVLRALLRTRDGKEKLPFENLIYTSKLSCIIMALFLIILSVPAAL